MKTVDLDRFHVALPRKRGKMIAASNYMNAAKALFPENSFEQIRRGSGWVVLKPSKPINSGWPESCDDHEHDALELNVERLGRLIVVVDDVNII